MLGVISNWPLNGIVMIDADGFCHANVHTIIYD